MKINVPTLVLVLTAVAWLGIPSASVRAAHSRHANGESGDTADISMFYDDLKPYGTWYNTSQYGDVWHPTVADQKPDWRPYTNGSWGQTDQGWTWLSDEPFGWAVYHYGRWTQLKDTGWVWVPDSEWATAWVAWRSSSNLQMAEVSGPADLSYHDADTRSAASSAAADAAPGANAHSAARASDAPDTAPDASGPAPDSSGPAPGGPAVAVNYIGWAPLPPDAELTVDGDIGPSVDASCDIDPDAYAFVDAADIGDPDLSVDVFPRDRDYFYVEHTLNVTNIAYVGRGTGSVYVGGPDFARVRAVSRQPVPALALDRQTRSRAVASSLRDGHGEVLHGNTLQIAGPRFKNRPVRGILGNRPSLPKADSARAGPPAGADPAAVTRAHDAMARQAHSTVSHAQVANAASSSQAEYRSARGSSNASASAPHTESAAGREEGRSSTSRGEEERTTGSRAGAEGRHHSADLGRTARTASHSAHSVHAAKPESFMDQLKRNVSEAGRQIAKGGQAAAREGAKGGGGRAAVVSSGGGKKK
jgi:hypothetical protein